MAPPLRLVPWWKHRKTVENVDQWYSSDDMDEYDTMAAASAKNKPEEDARNGEDDESLMEGDPNDPTHPNHPDNDPRMQGFSLAAATGGAIEGEFSLPKFDFYQIDFIISKRYPNSQHQGDPTDMVAVKMGHNLRNLNQVALVKNVVDEYSGQIRYECSYSIRAASLAYRFEFMSSGEREPPHHFHIAVTLRRERTSAPSGVRRVSSLEARARRTTSCRAPSAAVVKGRDPPI